MNFMLHRNLIVHLVPDDGDLPLKANSYDILVCVGSFIPGHIAYTSLPVSTPDILTENKTRIVSFLIIIFALFYCKN